MAITFEQIVNANKTIKTTDVKGKDYAEVNQRIKAFRMVHPNGSITTDIISLENGLVTMKSTITDENGVVIGTGLAQEKESSSFINKTSFIENCETSAVGRALGMCGFGIDTSIASYEEVTNAINNQNEPKKQNKQTKQSQAQVKDLAKEIMEFYKTHKSFGDVIKSMLKQNGVTQVSELPQQALIDLVELTRSSANSFQ